MARKKSRPVRRGGHDDEPVPVPMYVPRLFTARELEQQRARLHRTRTLNAKRYHQGADRAARFRRYRDMYWDQDVRQQSWDRELHGIDRGGMGFLYTPASRFSRFPHVLPGTPPRGPYRRP